MIVVVDDEGGFEKQDPKNPEDIVNINIIDREEILRPIKGKV